MRYIQPITKKVRKISEPAFFHNSREDARTLGRACNMLIDTVNELVEQVNYLTEELNELEHERKDK